MRHHLHDPLRRAQPPEHLLQAEFPGILRQGIKRPHLPQSLGGIVGRIRPGNRPSLRNTEDP
jgi:hypothetical protein